MRGPVQLLRGSVKQRPAVSSNNRGMNAIVDEIPEIATALAKCYADHSSIRRLWATADARLCLKREVQLQLVVSGAFGESDAGLAATSSTPRSGAFSGDPAKEPCQM